MAMLAETRRKKFYALCPKGKPLFEDENRFGSKMLMKMGWSKGKGLGAKEDGTQDFVRIRYKNDADGLGYDQKDDQWTQHEEHFNNILKSLNGSENNSDDNNNANVNANGIEDDLVTKGFGFTETSDTKGKKIKLKEKISGESLEEKSMKSRARVHYKKFTKGKDLTQYSEKDLANIFGKKAVEDEDKVNQQPCPNDIYKQLNGFTPEEKKEGDHQNSDEESCLHFAGVTTIKQTLSITDYFKQKMESLKNKRNKVACTDMETGGENPSNDAHESTSISKKKKSKKKYPPNEEQEQEVSNPHLDLVDTNNSKKNKKKKNVDIRNPLEILTPAAEAEQDSTVDISKKKKKRKNNDEFEDVIVLESSKKKKKKNEIQDIENNLEQISYEEDISSASDLPKKKKKSKKSLEGKNQAELFIEIDSLDLNKKKKKKKSKEKVDSEDIIQEDTDLKFEETKLRKSKKSKNCIPSFPSQDAVDQEPENLKVIKGKKNKISNICLDSSLVLSEGVLESEFTDSKKKKNKSEDSIDSSPIESEMKDLKEPKRKKCKKAKSETSLPVEAISPAESLESIDKDSKGKKSKRDKLSAGSYTNEVNENSSEENEAENNKNELEERVLEPSNEIEKCSLSNPYDRSEDKSDVDDKVSKHRFRPPKNLEDCERIFDSHNVFKVSQFSADKFALLHLENFKGSNLSQLSGYSFDENLVLNVVQSLTEEKYYERLMRYEEKKKFREKKEKQIEKYKKHLNAKYIQEQSRLESEKLKAEEEIDDENNDTVDDDKQHEILINEDKETNCDINKDSSNELLQQNNLPSSPVATKELEKSNDNTSESFKDQKALKNKSLKRKFYVELHKKKFHDKRKRRNAFSGI